METTVAITQSSKEADIFPLRSRYLIKWSEPSGPHGRQASTRPEQAPSARPRMTQKGRPAKENMTAAKKAWIRENDDCDCGVEEGVVDQGSFREKGKLRLVV